MEATLEKLEASLDPDKKGTLLGDFTEKLDEILEARLSLGDKGSLGQLKSELVKSFEQLRAEIKAASLANDLVVSVQKKLPAKGVAFEENVMEFLARLAQSRNDSVERVGNTPGIGNSKKGDLIYLEGVTQARIAIECKDYSASFAPSKIAGIMEEVLNNREADFGIFLVRNQDCLPESFGTFHVSTKFIACSIEYLEIAIKFAALRLQAEHLSKGTEQVDFGKVQRCLQAASREIEQLDTLLTSCSSAQKSIQKVSDAIARLKVSVGESLGVAQAAILGAESVDSFVLTNSNSAH
jgi:hypothetical protein